MKNNHINLRNQFKFLKYFGTKYSWMIAAEKCEEYGMTLPHLQNERKTREFITYTLNDYELPTYALFVGLVNKVRYEPTNQC